MLEFPSHFNHAFLEMNKHATGGSSRGLGFCFASESFFFFSRDTGFLDQEVLKNECRTDKCDQHTGRVIIQNKREKVQLNIFPKKDLEK